MMSMLMDAALGEDAQNIDSEYMVEYTIKIMDKADLRAFTGVLAATTDAEINGKSIDQAMEDLLEEYEKYKKEDQNV
jgi:hypothetical protein